MASDLAVFQFPTTGQEIRVIQRDGEPWFVARDVAEALDLRDHRTSVALLDEDERHTMPVADNLGRLQETLIINEAGLYSMILRSRKLEARAFKRWVTHEVLPAIRKTGGYVVPRQPSRAEVVLQMAQALYDHEQRLDRIDGEVSVLGARVDGIEQHTGWYVALAYAKLNKLPRDTPSLQRLGKEASRIARREGIRPVPVPNTAYGTVNSYPEEIWQEAAAIFQRTAR